MEVFHTTAVLEAHYRFLPNERGRPYLFGGLGGTTLEASTEEFDAETQGGVAVLGVALLYDLATHLVVDVSGRLDLVNWDPVNLSRRLPDGTVVSLEDPVDEDGSAAKLLFGLVWEF